MPHASADLLAALEGLAAASADALARLRNGDETGVLELIAGRERLLGEIAASTIGGAASVAEAARRAVALDMELLAALRERLAGVERELEQVARTRRSLTSYGARPAASSVFVERLS